MSYDDERPMVDSSYRPKSRRCCVVSVLCVALALVLILAIAIPVGIKNSKKDDELKGASAVGSACDATTYPDTCKTSLAGSDGSPTGMSRMMLEQSGASVEELNSTISNEQCKELFATTIDSIRKVLMVIENGTVEERNAACQDSQTQLSAAMENLDTCGQILEQLQSPESAGYGSGSQNATQSLSIVLAFVNNFCAYGNNVAAWTQTIPDGFQDILNQFKGGHRRLLDAEDIEDESREGNVYSGEEVYPGWMDAATSRHLLAKPAWYNVIVAKDGSGKYKSVQAAINAARSNKNPKGPRYVIYVKAGVYNEQITIPSDLMNCMIVGDGIDKTIFTGSRSVMLTRGMTTFLSATLIVKGQGFLGKFFSVYNTAGSAGHQAVACRVSADLVAFYNVKFDSYQDTLYAHSFRQFYSNCIVQGTVDFIFGNGNAVFQSCNIIAKKSQLQGQQNTYTAQGKADKNQNTGLAFQDCNFDGTSDLKKNVARYPTFLGRPWKMYSTCVLLRPKLQAHINPQGWLYWNYTDFGLWTSFFAEYKSTGPASNRAKRVKWSHEIKDPKIANKYQAASFISGKGWLPSLGIAYSLASV